MRKKIAFSFMALGVLTLLGAGCVNKLPKTSTTASLPSILASDQKLNDNNEISVDSASITDEGWVAVHAMEDGRPGPIIGYTSLLSGAVVKKIKITVDKTKVTPNLIAMLHYDRGEKGVFEFPGADGPVIKDQQVIMQEFKLLNFSEATKEVSATDTTVARKEFVITLKQWSFSPSVIKVKKDDLVTLKLRSVDVTHGLALPDFNVNVNVKAGETKTVEFKADKTGAFDFACAVYCGVGHVGMTGKLIVE